MGEFQMTGAPRSSNPSVDLSAEFPVRVCKTCGWKTTSTSTIDACIKCGDDDGLRPKHFLTAAKDTSDASVDEARTESELLGGFRDTLEEEAQAIVSDVDAWLEVDGPVTRTHLASVSARLKRALRRAEVHHDDRAEDDEHAHDQQHAVEPEERPSEAVFGGGADDRPDIAQDRLDPRAPRFAGYQTRSRAAENRARKTIFEKSTLSVLRGAHCAIID